MGVLLPCVQPTFLIKGFPRKTSLSVLSHQRGYVSELVTRLLQMFHREVVQFFLIVVILKQKRFFSPPGSTGMCLETFVVGALERVHYWCPVDRSQRCQGQPVVHRMAPAQRVTRTKMSKTHCFVPMTEPPILRCSLGLDKDNEEIM